MASNLLIGSTGAVGSCILTALLADSSIGAVHTISRRAPKSTGPTLHAAVEADTTQWAARLAGTKPTPSTVFSALGTTRQQAGGLANQWKIDHDLNVELARAAKDAGVRNFVFVSSAGTGSMFATALPYSKMKRGVEDTVRGLGFDTAIIVRPGMILAEREVPHQGGPLLIGAVRAVGRWCGLGMQDRFGQEADVIARAAVRAAKMAEEGRAPEKVWVLEWSDIVRLGRTDGFGRGSKELGIPTANLPVSDTSTPWIASTPSGVYFGWAALNLPPSHPDFIPTPTPTSPTSTSPRRGENGFTIYPMVMSIGYNPFYKNTVRSAEVHVLHNFAADFYGAEMRLLLTGFIREERDYSGLEALIADINFDCDVAKRSLAREGWAPRGMNVEVDVPGEGVKVLRGGLLECGWLVRPSELEEGEGKGKGE
ncbi:hypothetical protein C8A01DRAFT_49178 [Parachaetomium inaequale]|uniref:Riboflavin kinase n=1 Tax=Parachaetomium inaequale TaxID=2588326 RepID=A0AAN6P9Y5_9PEZI|nr:hypothetical protein C8A01DRAFT_49178 [Parachaetomium inaequale]